MLFYSHFITCNHAPPLQFTDSRFDAQSVGTVDEELRQLSINLTETTQRVAALSRKKGCVILMRLLFFFFETALHLLH